MNSDIRRTMFVHKILNQLHITDRAVTQPNYSLGTEKATTES